MTTTLRIDDMLKRDCDDVFERLGMSMSSAITVFLKHGQNFRHIDHRLKIVSDDQCLAVLRTAPDTR